MSVILEWRRAGTLTVRVAVAALLASLAAGCSRPSPEQASAPVAVTPSPARPESPPTPIDPAKPTPSAQFRGDVKAAAADQWSVLNAAALDARDIGAWDDFRVGSPIVMKEAGGKGYRMWFLGCQLGERHYGCAVGHATSTDGVEWARGDSPVFVPPNLPSTNWLSTLAVTRRADRYWMWYSVDAVPNAEEPRGTLHMATSVDGLAWENVGPVYSTLSGKTHSIKHTVHDDGQIVHLWYFDIPEGNDEALVHVTSPDGKTWRVVGDDTFNGRVGSLSRPWITSDGRGGFRALVIDRGERALKWLASTDGTMWTQGDSEAIPSHPRGTSIYGLAGLQDSNGLWLWTTTASGRRAAESIGVAFKKGSGS
jgi:hypothetical protein